PLRCFVRKVGQHRPEDAVGVVLPQRVVEPREPIAPRGFIIVDESNQIACRVANGSISSEGDVLLAFDIVGRLDGALGLELLNRLLRRTRRIVVDHDNVEGEGLVLLLLRERAQQTPEQTRTVEGADANADAILTGIHRLALAGAWLTWRFRN